MVNRGESTLIMTLELMLTMPSRDVMFTLDVTRDLVVDDSDPALTVVQLNTGTNRLRWRFGSGRTLIVECLVLTTNEFRRSD